MTKYVKLAAAGRSNFFDGNDTPKSRLDTRCPSCSGARLPFSQQRSVPGFARFTGDQCGHAFEVPFPS